MLQVADVSYGLPTRQLLRNVSFFLNRGEKVGLVGVNGAGKSTLLKIVVGELLPESGSVVCAGTVGYVPQSVPLDRTMSGMSVFEYVAEGRGLIRLQRELDHLTEEFEEAPTDQALEAYERVVTAFEAAGGWQARAAVGTLMARLGMGFLDLDSPFGALSGGQRARLAIGRALFAEPDLLVLDEPTNHLDPPAKEWLMSYLNGCRSTALVVSHDLQMLDRSIAVILYVDEFDQSVHLFKGNYSSFAGLRGAVNANIQRTVNAQRKQIKELRDSAEAMGASEKRAAQRKRLMRRVTELEEALPTQPRESRAIHVKFPPTRRSPEVVVRTQNVQKSYGTKQVVKPLTLAIQRGERLAVTGTNGAGKTTLLKLLAQEIEPTGGAVELGEGVIVGYYAQEQEHLDPSLTVLEEARRAAALGDGPLRGLLAQFGFFGGAVFQLTGSLSGGERSRLAICKLVLQGSTLLLLDEPTNNLDVLSTQQVLQALVAYQGAMLVVSHDAEFLRALEPTRAVTMPGGAITHFDSAPSMQLGKDRAGLPPPARHRPLAAR